MIHFYTTHKFLLSMILTAAGIQLMSLCPDGESSSSMMTIKLNQESIELRLLDYTSHGNLLNMTDEKYIEFKNLSHLYEYFDGRLLDEIIGGLTVQPDQTSMVIRISEKCDNYTLINPETNWYIQMTN